MQSTTGVVAAVYGLPGCNAVVHGGDTVHRDDRVSAIYESVCAACYPDPNSHRKKCTTARWRACPRQYPHHRLHEALYPIYAARGEGWQRWTWTVPLSISIASTISPRKIYGPIPR
jgi:hypothetical protein